MTDYALETAATYPYSLNTENYGQTMTCHYDSVLGVVKTNAIPYEKLEVP